MDDVQAAEPQLLVEEVGAILQVTLNRPDKLNAITTGMVDGLRSAVDDFRRRDDLRVFLIRAKGRYFCAGADLLGTSGAPNPKSTATIREWLRSDMSNGVQRLYDEMESIEKAFVVAHHGPCVGGGLELSLSCDFRLAAQSASYSFPETVFGMIPASNGISRFSRLVGAHWAKWSIMAGQKFSAERALAIGLVHDVYPDAEFEERVMALCQSLAMQPPEVTAMAKLTIGLAEDLTAEQARKVERLGASTLQIGEETAALTLKIQERLRRGQAKTEG